MDVFGEASLRQQLTLCHDRGIRPMPVEPGRVVRISGEVGGGKRPVHGARRRPLGQESGWTFWTGVPPAELGLFAKVDAASLDHLCPLVIKFLALPPGWRLLAYGTYFDLWFDDTIRISPPIREL